jgi:high-affinity Fe2+/Pb2+ permease
VEDDTHLGAKFWLTVIGAIIALGIGALILFLLVDVVWYLWGAVGTFLILFLVAGLIGYFYDRRQQRRYEDLPA